MKSIYKVMMISGLLAVTAGCGQKKSDFKYLLDEFADLKVMRYTVPGWEELSLQQKEYAYHLAEAAKWDVTYIGTRTASTICPYVTLWRTYLRTIRVSVTARSLSSLQSMPSDFSLPMAYTITMLRTSSSRSAHRTISSLLWRL